MRKAILYLAFLFLFMNMECDDAMVPEGKLVHVHGYIYDLENELPVANHQLTVAEYNRKPAFTSGQWPKDYIGIVGTVFTNADGYYDLVFTTSGNGDTYYIFPEQTANIWLEYVPEDNLDVTISNEVNFFARNLYPATLKITTAQGVNYQFAEIIQNSIGRLDKIVQPGGGDIKAIFIDKRDSLRVNFTRYNSGIIEKAVFKFPPTNTTEPTEFEINLTNNDFH